MTWMMGKYEHQKRRAELLVRRRAAPRMMVRILIDVVEGGVAIGET